jgi:hypothetical protein
MRRCLLAALILALVACKPALAQVPPIGSGTNGWLNALFNQLANSGSGLPKTNITGNASGTVGAVVGTLASAAGKTTFICGFTVASIGGTAATGPITIANLTGGSMVYQLTSSATGTTVSQTFAPNCIPASAAATAITITTTANGTASAVNVNSWGYQQ